MNVSERKHVGSRAKRRRIRIRGAWWTVRYQRPPVKERLDGMCHYATRTIYVNPAAMNQRSTLVHEVLHAALPDLCEDAVEGAEDAIETALG
jgi:hypothetical protein